MDRIGPAGGSPTGTLTNGQQGFIDENLAAGQEGTMVVSNFLNAVQEELMTLLSNADITPDITNFGQVMAAIIALMGQQLAAYFNTGSGAFYFSIPIPGQPPLIIQGRAASVPAGDVNTTILCPIAFPNNFGGGLAVNGQSGEFQFGVSAGTTLANFTLACMLYGVDETGAITARTTSGGAFVILWGN